ncbi:MAG: hypothetical protein FD189_2310 [Elusimicrobia bacterium]|nr:MAG: hypothetical protein FD154_1116 [Elusimicrobiota bacterium]KAF0153730.1 MAG: hypothetical protein FD189_2310 [Elusimicrobiota bacterium]
MENNKPFSDKNLLLLVTLREHQYIDYLAGDLEKYFKRTHVFNFIGYSREHGLSATEDRIRELIRENDIYLVLVIQLATDFELSPEYYASLRGPAKLVFWFFDDDMYFSAVSKYYAAAADAVMTHDYFPSLAYKQLGIPSIYATPIYDPEIFHPVPAAKDIDVCCVCDCTKADRMEYIDFLTAGGIKVETYGHGSKNGFLPEERDISAIYSRSRIVITFSRLDKPRWPVSDDPLLERVRQNKGHFAQIALTRSFCLSEYAPALNLIAGIGSEVAVFNDKNELLSQVRYYLAHDKEREEMADRAYETAKRTFVGAVAFPKLLHELRKTLDDQAPVEPGASPPALSAAFRSNIVNGLTFSFFILLGEGRFSNAGELLTRLFRCGPRAFLSGFPAGTIRALTVFFHKLTGG